MKQKSLKEKGREIKKLRKCFYCDFRCKDRDVLKEHEERLHGCFRDKVNRTQAKEKIQVHVPGISRELGVKTHYKNYPINRDDPAVYQSGDGYYHYKCLNCGVYHRTKRKYDTKKDLLLCINCGLNIFRDNRQRVYDGYIKKGKKIPSAINVDVVKSVLDEKKKESNREKINEMFKV